MFLSERSIASATCSPSSMIAKYCFPPLRPRGQFKSSKFLRCCLHNNPDPGHGTTNLPSLWGALFSQSSNSCFIVYDVENEDDEDDDHTDADDKFSLQMI